MGFEFLWAVTSAGQLLLIWVLLCRVYRNECLLKDILKKLEDFYGS